MKRFFLKDTLGKNLMLAGTEHNHLANVLRLKIGDEIILCNGDEYDYQYKIANITKSQSQLLFVKKAVNEHNPRVDLTVFLAYIKHDNLSLVVEKLNELGVTRLCLFSTERCNISKTSIKLEKLQSIVEQSCKQCCRSFPMQVQFSDIKDIAEFDTIVFADETQDSVSIASVKPIGKTAIVIGPEGGFTETERKKIVELKGQSVSLGVRILRAETAAIASASIVLSKMGEI